MIIHLLLIFSPAFVGIAIDVRPKRKIPNINADSTVQDIVLVNEN